MLSQRTTDTKLPEGKAGKGSLKLGWQCASVLILCAIFAASVISFSRSTSATYDELAHLPAGYSYLRWHDYRLNPEHPPLIKKLAAWPLLWRQDRLSGVDLARMDAVPTSKSLTNSENILTWAWDLSLDDPGEEWVFGHFFLYGIRPEAIQKLQAANSSIRGPLDVPSLSPMGSGDFYNDADDVLFWSRMPVLLLGLALALLVFSWSRELFGFAGGVLSLALFCFDPNFIAHSGLVTTDVGEALFMFGAIYFLWRTCRRWTAANQLLFLFFFGLAFAAKFSAVFLLPIFWLAACGWLLARPAPVGAGSSEKMVAPVLKRFGRMSALFAAALLVTYFIIWAVYSFRYSAAADPRQAAQVETRILTDPGNRASVTPAFFRQPAQLPTESVIRTSAALKKLLRENPQLVGQDELDVPLDKNAPIGLVGRLILFAQRHELLPEAFLYGFSYVEMNAQLHPAFLLGRYSKTGFYSYFPTVFLLKTTVPALGCLLGGLVLMRRAVGNWTIPFLLAPVALYFAVAISSHLNLGLRHLLPIYPFLYVLAGSLALEWVRLSRRIRGAAAILIMLAIALSSRLVFFPLNHQWWQPVAPHYLAYFNELAGGPGNGYKELVDSNLDWGQDLKSLKAWLAARHITDPIYLSYFGTADPRFYGIRHYNLPGGYPYEPKQDFGVLQKGGLIAISANNLQGVSLTPKDRQAWANVLEHSEFVDTVGYSIFIFRFSGFENN